MKCAWESGDRRSLNMRQLTTNHPDEMQPEPKERKI